MWRRPEDDQEFLVHDNVLYETSSGIKKSVNDAQIQGEEKKKSNYSQGGGFDSNEDRGSAESGETIEMNASGRNNEGINMLRI